MQSCEAGGHGASGASLVTFIPELVDHVQALCEELSIQPAVPVVAAGGIVDGRQVMPFTAWLKMHAHASMLPVNNSKLTDCTMLELYAARLAGYNACTALTRYGVL